MTNAHHGGVRLQELAGTLGSPLVELLAAPAGADVPIRRVVIVEPGDATEAGDLALLVGVRGAAAVPAIEAAAATAVAIKLDREGETAEVEKAAVEAGVAVLAVADGVRWQQVEALAGALVERARDSQGEQSHPDLFSLADTVATLTGGPVTIEDVAHRVLAYSHSDDEVDQVRRQSILGRTCPDDYLSHLQRLGVFGRIWSEEEVVEVPGRPELGLRRRMVAGVSAGDRPLGSIWVQEAGRPLAGRSAEVLRGAARMAALWLVRADGGASRTDELAVGLLTGEFDTAALAAHLGVDPAAPTTVIGLDLRMREEDRSALEIRRDRLTDIISVHAAAFHRGALVIPACGNIYVLLPRPSRAGDWLEELVDVLRRRTGTPVQAAVAGVAERLDDIPAVKKRASRILRLMAGEPGLRVATESRMRAALLLDGVAEALAQRPDVRDPAIDRLAAEHPDLARSLRVYLERFGDVNEAAAVMHVHPNTLRHRMRRVTAMTELDLNDPEHRLAALIQLRTAT
ncbi:helix-turn-helix domain-containing protein [Nonomuraea monospora]